MVNLSSPLLKLLLHSLRTHTISTYIYIYMKTSIHCKIPNSVVQIYVYGNIQHSGSMLKCVAISLHKVRIRWSTERLIPSNDWLYSTKLIGGVYWYHLVRLSVCPSVDRIVSALYLQQYSLDLFHICTSYQATSEGVSRVMPVSKFKNLKFWQIV